MEPTEDELLAELEEELDQPVVDFSAGAGPPPNSEQARTMLEGGL